MKKEIKIAILASGAGSNADVLLRYFNNHILIKIELVVCNVPDAGVIAVAKKHGVASVYISNSDLEFKLLSLLHQNKIDALVLAGFLRKIPANVVSHYSNRILNIHPALLPKYGGKGMYGAHVHNAVIANKEVESGITIHLVNDFYDEGEIVFQASCSVQEGETPQTLAKKIHQLEHQNFAPVIENWITKTF